MPLKTMIKASSWLLMLWWSSCVTVIERSVTHPIPDVFWLFAINNDKGCQKPIQEEQLMVFFNNFPHKMS
jgi:hypothetical protein